ncbi:MAG: hypothetical protein GX278_01120 [Aeromonadales bacterium]|nr:hypothetical protein [Aeromonadales bacterium]
MLDSKQTNKEELSSLFDGENIQSKEIDLSNENKTHLEKWSLIGAALRNEMPEQINLDFASKVMTKIEHEQINPNKVAFNFNFSLKKVAFAISELAVAASVAAITVIGWQTYNAQGGISNSTSDSLGAVEGVNLASYQTSQNHKTLKFAEYSDSDNKSDAKLSDNELKAQQSLEVERINNYIRGYVLNTAAN